MKQTCATCAWRATCAKKFSVSDPSRCPDYVADQDLIKQYPEDDTSDSPESLRRKPLHWERMQENSK